MLYVEHGNTTVYEWRYGEPPLRIEEPPLLLATETEAPSSEDAVKGFPFNSHPNGYPNFEYTSLQIDFGDGAIDFGTEDVELETGDIDWGQIDMLNDAHEAAIDFSTTDDATLDIVVQEAGVEGGVAKDNEALTMLDYHKTRNMFIDDIMEVRSSSLQTYQRAKKTFVGIQLEAFLKQRLMEMQNSSNQSQMSFNLTQSKTEISVQQLEKMISLVMSAADSINRPKLKNLALIRESPRYVS